MTLHDLERAGLLDAMRVHARAEAPNECCGLVLRGDPLTLLPCENVADAWHAADPDTFPRTSRTAYLIDPRVLMAHEGSLVAVYHSHPAGDARFSPEDVAMAAPLGEPLWPGLTYVVIGLGDGTADARLFAWDDTTHRYEERP
ncbi:MAG: hypothetical protein AMXMBFR64_56110 [Myxococcales bacterium]